MMYIFYDDNIKNIHLCLVSESYLSDIETMFIFLLISLY